MPILNKFFGQKYNFLEEKKTIPWRKAQVPWGEKHLPWRVIYFPQGNICFKFICDHNHLIIYIYIVLWPIITKVLRRATA
jgi:hypothetical protein